MAPLSFLDLPMEIKLKILQQVVYTPNLEQEDMFDMYIEWTANGGFIVSEDVSPFSIFLVSKSFSVLVQQIFWSQNRFSLLPPEHFLIFRGSFDDHIPSSRYAASYFFCHESEFYNLSRICGLWIFKCLKTEKRNRFNQVGSLF